MLKTGTQPEILFQAAAYIGNCIFKAVEDHKICSLVLAGGNSPRQLYRMLAGGIPVSALQKKGFGFPEKEVINRNGTPCVMLPWHSVMLFWGDERCVPEHHPDSNFRMARESLISAVKIPEHNLFPMPHVTKKHQEAALSYERELKDFFDKNRRDLRDSFPAFDLVLLGMGFDGHVASLFPGDKDALAESSRWVIPVHAPKGTPPGYRLSLTLPVINSADSVMFFVTGREKENMVRDIAANRRPDLPAAMVKPKQGELVWFYGKN